LRRHRKKHQGSSSGGEEALTFSEADFRFRQHRRQLTKGDVEEAENQCGHHRSDDDDAGVHPGLIAAGPMDLVELFDDFADEPVGPRQLEANRGGAETDDGADEGAEAEVRAQDLGVGDPEDAEGRSHREMDHEAEDGTGQEKKQPYER